MNDQEKKLLEKSAQSPDEVIRQDIAETEREIQTMMEEAAHLEGTPMSLSSARWDHMRASARRTGVAEMQWFVAKLKKILELRQQA